jgi:hypothetical protein
LAGRELVVGVSPDSNNSARKLCSAFGGRITFAGGGDGVGQTLGLAARPPVAQPEIASAHASHNSISDGRGRSAFFFMLRSDGGHGLGLGVLSGTGLIHLLDLSSTSLYLLSSFFPLGPIAAPGPACTEHRGRPRNRRQQIDSETVHQGTSGGITAPTWRIADSSDMTRSRRR